MLTLPFASVRGRALAALLLLLPAESPAEIPAFARRYRVSCRLCHNPVPALTAFGEQFAANGYRMASGEEPSDTTQTGDDLLTLLRDVPLAVRLDLYAQAYANGRAVTDFQTPYSLKILAGGAISKTISFYFYTFLLERGDIGGVEDAFIHFNDIGGVPVDAGVGQFQVSDPLFKRELRLEFEDYAAYRARLGAVPVDLTYDRGVMLAADAAGFTTTFELLNGSGIGAAQPDRHFDIDASKNLFLHVTRDVAKPLRVGAFGYYGRSHGNGTTNRTRMLAADATATVGPVELNGQYIHRRDDEPTYTAGEPEVRMNGGFVEAILRPPGKRWYGFALYNLVTADRPLLDVRLGGEPGADRYESVSGGGGYLVRRNFRVSGEVTHDLGPDLTRVTFGIVTAF
ncbi:MAG TPA: hypothetical protein VHJ69_08845 [Gemmatimonadales bacterium]|jgi:hypothetical protein|nr:hypothetical protein [Gemmatimonadales bacterium]